MSDLINALRRIAKISYGATIEEAQSVSKTQRDAADLLEQQAARIAELEAQAGEAVAWQVRRADGRIDGVQIQWEPCTKDLYDATLATGRYAGYEKGPRCEVRALFTHPPIGDAAGKDSVDAARYRWLRDFDIRATDGVDIKPPCEHVHASVYSHAVGALPATRLVSGNELDRIVDAAIASLTKTATGDKP